VRSITYVDAQPGRVHPVTSRRGERAADPIAGTVPGDPAAQNFPPRPTLPPGAIIGPIEPLLVPAPTAPLPPSRSSRRMRRSPESAERVAVPAVLGIASCRVGAVWSGRPSASTAALRA